jgi:hypothetical protein
MEVLGRPFRAPRKIARGFPGRCPGLSQVGPLGLVRGAWSVGSGPWGLVRGVWSVGSGPWGLVRGVWSVGSGPWGLVRGAWSVGPGPWGLVRGAWSVPLSSARWASGSGSDLRRCGFDCRHEEFNFFVLHPLRRGGRDRRCGVVGRHVELRRRPQRERSLSPEEPGAWRCRCRAAVDGVVGVSRGRAAGGQVCRIQASRAVAGWKPAVWAIS